MEGKTVVFNGETYIRNPKSRYYFKHTTRNAERKNARQLHRVVWEYYNGPIPAGYHVHHIDGNIDNNAIDNLECLPAKKHLSMHAQKNETNAEYVERQKETIKLAVEAAKEWHGSDAGRAWHRAHVAESIGKVRDNPVSKECTFCGKVFQGLPWSRYCCSKCANKARYARDKAKAQLM